MRTYTLHLPAGARPGDPEALEKAVLVRDGFAWAALFFSVLWFFFHRLWLAGLGVLVLLIVFHVVLAVLDVHALAAGLAEVLVAFLIGLEANSLRRWTLTRRGRPAVAVVMARDRDQAETLAFARWLGAKNAAPVQAAPAMGARYRGPEPVIGLFPEAERGR